MNIEFDHPTRGAHYRQANQEVPSARLAEIQRMVEEVAPNSGERIVDFGCGSGALSLPLSRRVGKAGVIYAIDNSLESILDLLSADSGLNIRPIVSESIQLPFEPESIDAVSTLANFHHVSDKQALLSEFHRVLKPGGRIVIGDVAANSNVQKYFDGPVDRYCSTGHKHRFLDEQWATLLCDEAGFESAQWIMADVPWVFENEAQAKRFLHLIFDVSCTAQEFLEQTKSFIGFTCNATFRIDWTLAYLSAKKPCVRHSDRMRDAEKPTVAAAL